MTPVDEEPERERRERAAGALLFFAGAVAVSVGAVLVVSGFTNPLLLYTGVVALTSSAVVLLSLDEPVFD
ncbi:MAG: hypothetical protein ACLFR5_02730 [Halobacteriales archaeon]